MGWEGQGKRNLGTETDEGPAQAEDRLAEWRHLLGFPCAGVGEHQPWPRALPGLPALLVLKDDGSVRML